MGARLRRSGPQYWQLTGAPVWLKCHFSPSPKKKIEPGQVWTIVSVYMPHDSAQRRRVRRSLREVLIRLHRRDLAIGTSRPRSWPTSARKTGGTARSPMTATRALASKTRGSTSRSRCATFRSPWASTGSRAPVSTASGRRARPSRPVSSLRPTQIGALRAVRPSLPRPSCSTSSSLVPTTTRNGYSSSLSSLRTLSLF